MNTSNNLHDRKGVLTNLLSLNEELGDLKDQLSKFAWDSEELVILRKSHLRSLLKKYLENKINESIIITWANMIELRDDIGYEATHEELIKRIIFELANPKVNPELTPKIARHYYEILS